MTKQITDYLTCPMPDNDSGSETVGGYLAALLVTLYHEGEGFSGKRPFGNGGWEDDVARAWVRNGLMPGEVANNEWGEEIDYDEQLFLTILAFILNKCLVD